MFESCHVVGCTLPKGHNRGKADVPSAHGESQPQPRSCLLGPDAARAWAERLSEDVPKPQPEKVGHYFTEDSLATALERVCGDTYIEVGDDVYRPMPVPDAAAIIKAAKEAERPAYTMEMAREDGYTKADEAERDPEMQRCHADCDGDCAWVHCPQLRDGEPSKSGRHCPLDDRRDEW